MNTQGEQVPADLKHREDANRSVSDKWINWSILDDNTSLKVMMNIRHCQLDFLYFEQYVHTNYNSLEYRVLFEPSFVTEPADKVGRR